MTTKGILPMSEFKAYHPINGMLYFIAVIGFSTVFMHPASLAFSLVGSFAMCFFTRGVGRTVRALAYMLPVALLAAVINPAFNHRGVTVLAYLPSGNPLTLESIVYGLAASAMIVSVILWFSCLGEIMTSDKIIYLFGRVIPSLSLIFSMTLRFVPRLLLQLKDISRSQRCVGRGDVGKGVLERARGGLSVISALTTMALENSVETADSMKARGYGLPGRTAFSIFRFDRRDAVFLSVTVILSVYIIVGGIFDGMYCRYFPSVKLSGASMFEISVFAAYFVLCMLPCVIELWEVIRWRR